MRTSLLFFALLFSKKLICQEPDSIPPKFNFGWQIVTGMQQQNFSPLYHYDYLFDTPRNISFLYPSASVFAGNPQKLFVSAFIGVNVGGTRNGTFNTYNSYTVTASGSCGFYGGALGFPLVKRYDHRGLQGIYMMVGASQLKEWIFSKATGQAPSGNDTSFYFENSKARAMAGKLEFIFEFSRKTNQQAKMRMPFVLKAGYNFQLGKPVWSGTYSRNPGDENPNVNLGGWYLSAGFNFWTAKGFWKSSFAKPDAG